MSVWSGFAAPAANGLSRQSGWYRSPNTPAHHASTPAKQPIGASAAGKAAPYRLAVECPANTIDNMTLNTAADLALALGWPRRPDAGDVTRQSKQRLRVAGCCAQHWRWGK